MIRVALVFTAALSLSATATAQGRDSHDLTGRNVLSAGIGLTANRVATAGAAGSNATASGHVVMVAFTHFVGPEFAISVVGSILESNASSGGVATHADVIAPIHFGVSYWPHALMIGPSVRPYALAGVGPYLHFQSDASSVSGTSSSQNAKIGARVGGGVNWFAAPRVVFRLEGDYDLVGDFPLRSGGIREPGGFSAVLSAGYAWGATRLSRVRQ